MLDTAPIGHNQPPIAEPSETIRQRVDKLKMSTMEIPESLNEETAGLVTQLGKQINATIKTLDDERKTVKQPYLDAGREIDANYKVLSIELQTLKKTVSKHLTEYQKSLIPADDGSVKTHSKYGHTASLQDWWKFEVKVLNVVPYEWLKVDEDKVNAAIRRKDNPVREIPGLRIYNEPRTIVR